LRYPGKHRPQVFPLLFQTAQPKGLVEPSQLGRRLFGPLVRDSDGRTYEEAIDAIAEHYYREVDRDKLLDAGLTGAVKSLDDRFSAYFDPRSYRVDFARARKELGFEAQWSIPDGAVQLAKEYRERGLTQEAFDKKFTRLAVLAARQQKGELDESMRVVA
jgi:C-terminal processing protease CtpA/Prc